MENMNENNLANPGTLDKDIDIMALLKGEGDGVTPTDNDMIVPKKKSAIELAKEAKQQGLVVDNAELAEKNQVKTISSSKSEADAFKEMEAYQAEQDQLINAARKVSMTKNVASAESMVQLMDELETVANGGDTEGSEMLRMKTDEELAQNSVTAGSDVMDVTPQAPVSNTAPADTKKTEIVNILIDKTGYGDGKIEFSEEEKEKLVNSSLIRVKEIENLDISTLNIRRAEKSFVEESREYQFGRNTARIAFPASRFTATMSGLSYGEMGDLAFNPETVTFEQVRKRLTVIYNKMRNPSCGKFESFDDFLRKFAYMDMDLAIFALAIATFPEWDDIALSCQNPGCKKGFNHRYSPRSLISYERMDEKILSVYKDLTEASPAQLEKMVHESPTRKSTYCKLPESGFIIEIGVVSAYEYLYNVVDNLLGDKFENEHPDDVNGILQMNTAMLSLVRSVLVPYAEGGYTQYDKFEDMIQALYMIKPEEVQILANMLSKYTTAYNVQFELRNITCPHCGTVTKRLPIDIADLVFRRYQKLMSSELELDGISVL